MSYLRFVSVVLSSAMEMRSPYWALVRCLNHNPASVKLLIHLKGPTNWWGRTHTEQSSGHSRYGLHLQMLALHFNASSTMEAGYRHIVSYLSFFLLSIISYRKRHQGFRRVV